MPAVLEFGETSTKSRGRFDTLFSDVPVKLTLRRGRIAGSAHDFARNHGLIALPLVLLGEVLGPYLRRIDADAPVSRQTPTSLHQNREFRLSPQLLPGPWSAREVHPKDPGPHSRPNLRYCSDQLDSRFS